LLVLVVIGRKDRPMALLVLMTTMTPMIGRRREQRQRKWPRTVGGGDTQRHTVSLHPRTYVKKVSPAARNYEMEPQRYKAVNEAGEENCERSPRTNHQLK
jgi:hypothetical protein